MTCTTNAQTLKHTHHLCDNCGCYILPVCFTETVLHQTTINHISSRTDIFQLEWYSCPNCEHGWDSKGTEKSPLHQLLRKLSDNKVLPPIEP